MTNTPLRTIRIDDALWAQVQDAAKAEDVPVSAWVRDALRSALKTAAAVLVAVLAALALTACGAAEPDTGAAAERSASSGAVVTPEASEPGVSPSATTEDCWTDPNITNPHWQVQFNAISGDPVRAVEMLDALPDPQEGCGAPEQASLEYAQEVAQTMRERFPQLF